MPRRHYLTLPGDGRIGVVGCRVTTPRWKTPDIVPTALYHSAGI